MQRYYDGARPKIKWPKTPAGTRKVPVLSPLSYVLSGRKGGPVFSGNSGEMMTDHDCKAAWKKYVAETGIACTSHQLRHAFATILFETDVSEGAAQEIMGYADISTTARLRQIRTHTNSDW